MDARRRSSHRRARICFSRFIIITILISRDELDARIGGKRLGAANDGRVRDASEKGVREASFWLEGGIRAHGEANVILITTSGTSSSGGGLLLLGEGAGSHCLGLVLLLFLLVALVPIDIGLGLDGGLSVLVVDVLKPTAAKVEGDPFVGREEGADEGDGGADVVGGPDQAGADGEEHDGEADEVVGAMHEAEEDQQDATEEGANEHAAGDGDGEEGVGIGGGNLEEGEGQLTDDDTTRADGEIAPDADDHAVPGPRRVAFVEGLMGNDEQGDADDDPIRDEDETSIPALPFIDEKGMERAQHEHVKGQLDLIPNGQGISTVSCSIRFRVENSNHVFPNF